MSDSCVFCRIVRQQIPAEVLYEDRDCVIVRDINPSAPTHVVVLARYHIPDLVEAFDAGDPIFEPSHGQTVRMMLFAASDWAKVNLPGGFRVVTNVGADAGQTIKHLHFHILGGGPLGAMASVAEE